MKINLSKSLFILPNLFTLSSVLCGFYAILLCTDQASAESFYQAALLIVFAMFFDTVDGRVARLTKTQSQIGVQLDSLADVISFGVAPAVLVYRWALSELGWVGLFVSFAYIAAGAIRLARFNVLTTGASGAPKKPGKYIAGLPIPAAAGIVVSLVVVDTLTGSLPGSPFFIVAVIATLGFFMVSTIRFRSFKDLRLSWRTGLFVVFAVGSTVFVAVRFRPELALIWLLVAYVAIGIAEALLGIARHLRRRARPSADEGEPEGRSPLAD